MQVYAGMPLNPAASRLVRNQMNQTRAVSVDASISQCAHLATAGSCSSVVDGEVYYSHMPLHPGMIVLPIRRRQLLLRS